ncbi:MAG: SynChlorMet cassette radical SAM/SPASM protein ScmE [Anaerolineae bacterium]|nr:SynChlorMet cassette radical SAM/SPASM protein ScmE [Anaerolineae bacterium]
MTTPLPPILDLVAPYPGVSSRPREVDLSLTGRCNLKCQYCFFADEMAAHGDLPRERWLAFFAEMGELGVQRVTLSGGEVFTRRDLFELIDGIIANRMRYSILTNGTLITPDTIAQFAVGKRCLRLDAIQVSIDGSTAEVHDKSRPPHSFDRAVRGLRLLIEHGFPITVRVTINRHNVDDLERIAAFLLDELGLPGFSTNEAQPMGSARCYGEGIMLTPQERQRAMATLLRLADRYGNRISAQAGPLSRARMFDEIEARLARGETGQPGRGTLCSCGGVFSKMAVLHDGTMVPCNMLPMLTMGIIGVNPLKEVWQRHPSINVVRQRQQIPLRSLPGCADCDYAGFCTGGCPATVMAQTGQLNAIDPMTCYRHYLDEQAALAGSGSHAAGGLA